MVFTPPAAEGNNADSPGHQFPEIDLARIDRFLDDFDKAPDDDARRRVFASFESRFASTDLDPYSPEYREYVEAMYEHLHGKEYDTAHEVTPFDHEHALQRPFPYMTNSVGTVGDHLMALGHLLTHLRGLPPGSRVLDCGAGWGNTTMSMAKAGLNVTAIDIDDNFIRLLTERAELESCDVRILKGDFAQVMTGLADAGETFDAIVFFESFHHGTNAAEILTAVDRLLTKDGRLILSSEPISEGFPVPWGLRMDGESLWAIRRNGWMELGYQTNFFVELLRRHGFVTRRTALGPVAPNATTFTVQRAADVEPGGWDYDSGLRHEVGERTASGVRADGRRGLLMVSPDIAATAGRRRITVDFTASPTPVGLAVVQLYANNHLVADEYLAFTPGRPAPAPQLFVDLPAEGGILRVQVLVGPKSRLEVTGMRLEPVTELEQPTGEPRASRTLRRISTTTKRARRAAAPVVSRVRPRLARLARKRS